MKLVETPWWAKMVAGLITISVTIVGSLWGGFEILDLRMDSKVEQGEKRVMTYINGMKKARDEEITGIKNEFKSEVGGIKAQLSSMDSKLNLLIGMGRQRSQLRVEKEDQDLYTNIGSPKGEDTL